MLWEKAKYLIIIFFLLLNILLAALLFREESRYTLSDEQDRAIRSVFRQHNINTYTRLVRRFKPMRRLAVSGFFYDMERIVSVLFSDPSSVEKIADSRREIYANGEGRLVLSNGFISFSYLYDGGELSLPSREEAAALCEAFIKKNYPDFVLDVRADFDDGYRFRYSQVYEKYVVYGNFIEFFVDGNGIRHIDMQYGEVIRFDGLEQEICSPDEALLTFTQHFRSIDREMPVIIDRMDIVYYQEVFSDKEYIPLQSTPYYRIFINNQEVPFLINAYTNICIN